MTSVLLHKLVLLFLGGGHVWGHVRGQVMGHVWGQVRGHVWGHVRGQVLPPNPTTPGGQLSNNPNTLGLHLSNQECWHKGSSFGVELAACRLCRVCEHAQPELARPQSLAK